MKKYIGIPGKVPYWTVTARENKKTYVQDRHDWRLFWSTILTACILAWTLEMIGGYLCLNGRLSSPAVRQLEADLRRTAHETQQEHDRYRYYPELSQSQDHVADPD